MKWVISILLGLAALASADRCEAGKARARQLYEQGVKQYNLGDFEPALQSFRAAYTEYSEPTILFNLAQCERQLGNKAKAITLYRSYLRELPDASNGAEVRRMVTSLDEDLQREQAAKAPQTEAPDLKAAPAPSATGATKTTAAPSKDAPALVVAARPEPPKARHSKAWVWAVVAGGAVVAVGVGLGLGLGLPSDRYPSASAGSGVLR